MRFRAFGVTALAVIVALLLVPVLAGCGSAVVGSGKTETREMDFTGFTRIEISHSFEATVTRADDFYIDITADDNLFQHIDVRMSGDTLYVRMDPNRFYSNITARAVITLPELNKLSLSGASQASVSGFSDSRAFRFDISGASRLILDDMAANSVGFDISGASGVSGNIAFTDGSMDLSGASKATLVGTASFLDLNASGASHADLDAFPVDTVEMDLSGASRAELDIKTRLDADLSGASQLTYRGQAIIGSLESSGGSNIKHLQ